LQALSYSLLTLKILNFDAAYFKAEKTTRNPLDTEQICLSLTATSHPG
jgi:hypothetical protein